VQEQASHEPSGWAHALDADPQRRAGSHRGSDDPADDLSGNTESGADGDRDDGDPAPEVDVLPGDGSVGVHPPSGDVDALVTADHGREAQAAGRIVDDTAPVPLETPPG
jgi:hypothetical protein